MTKVVSHEVDLEVGDCEEVIGAAVECRRRKGRNRDMADECGGR